MLRTDDSIRVFDKLIPILTNPWSGPCILTP
jgi:hypothetical protein